MLIIFSFIVGTIIGSFLNVVILRGARGESLGGRSRCESCLRTLSIKELIPIFSFAFQKGRCRNCGVALLLQYPLVELSAGIAYAWIAWLTQTSIPFTPEIFLFLFLADSAVAGLIVIIVSDLKYKIIPDGAVLALVPLGILLTAQRNSFFPDISAAIILSLFFASLWFFSNGRWMGLGDAKLTFAISCILGFPMSLIAFLFSFWIGGAIGIILLATRIKSMGDAIPFGPYIIIGSTVAFVWGDMFLHLTGLYHLL